MKKAEPEHERPCRESTGPVSTESGTSTGKPVQLKERSGVGKPMLAQPNINTEAPMCEGLRGKGASPKWRESDADMDKPYREQPKAGEAEPPLTNCWVNTELSV